MASAQAGCSKALTLPHGTPAMAVRHASALVGSMRKRPARTDASRDGSVAGPLVAGPMSELRANIVSRQSAR